MGSRVGAALVVLVASAWLGSLSLFACGGAEVRVAPNAETDDLGQPSPDARDEDAGSLGADAPRDTSPSDSNELEAWADAGACNDLISTGPFVSWTFVAAPPPVMTGGVVEPGVYELTKLEMFQGGTSDASAPSPVAETWRLQPADAGFLSAIAMRGLLPDGGVGRVRISARVRVHEDTPLVFSETWTCPADGTLTIGLRYTFTGTGPGATLRLFWGKNNPLLETYTKR